MTVQELIDELQACLDKGTAKPDGHVCVWITEDGEPLEGGDRIHINSIDDDHQGHIDLNI